jgi:NADPH:quinone reductase-like Zn-dependent oxidoreductase
MKAIRFHAHGGPEVLRFEDAPDPELRPGWVLVRVRACALNRLDIWQRRGLDRVKIPLPHISGADVAGVVAQAGDGVAGWGAGDRVMLQPGLSCGVCAPCLSGHDNSCPRYDVLGYQSNGGYAELVSVPAANLIRLPDSIDFVRAAAFPLTFLTAWHMLLGRALLTERDTVLVIAAGSGVGQAAVQIAKAMRATVLATAGGADKTARARDFGADAVIDHHGEDVVARVRELTGGRGVDYAFEVIGLPKTMRQAYDCLAKRGLAVIVGVSPFTAEVSVPVMSLVFEERMLTGSIYGSARPRHDIPKLIDLYRARKLKLDELLTRSYPFKEINEAYEALERGEVARSVVVF